MTHFLSATDVAIRRGRQLGTLRVTRETGRLGEFFAISDDHGLIEVHLTLADADNRIASIGSGR